MDLNRFARQLQREVRAHPKKAVFLGLAALVALWFWAGLLLGWAKEKPPAVSPSKTTMADGDASGTPGAAAVRSDGPAQGSRHGAPSWDHVARWIDADPRTVPARQPLARPEPFHPVQRDAGEQETAEKNSELNSSTPTPEEAGLVLSSTSIGPSRRVALISGRAYLERQSVTITKDNQPMTFTLTEIHDRRVVLERQGKRYELSIPEQRLSGSIQVAPHTN